MTLITNGFYILCTLFYGSMYVCTCSWGRDFHAKDGPLWTCWSESDHRSDQWPSRRCWPTMSHCIQSPLSCWGRRKSPLRYSTLLSLIQIIVLLISYWLTLTYYCQDTKTELAKQLSPNKTQTQVGNVEDWTVQQVPPSPLWKAPTWDKSVITGRMFS